MALQLEPTQVGRTPTAPAGWYDRQMEPAAVLRPNPSVDAGRVERSHRRGRSGFSRWEVIGVGGHG